MNQKKQKADDSLSQSPCKLNQKVNKSFHDFSISQDSRPRNRLKGKMHKSQGKMQKEPVFYQVKQGSKYLQADI